MTSSKWSRYGREGSLCWHTAAQLPVHCLATTAGDSAARVLVASGAHVFKVHARTQALQKATLLKPRVARLHTRISSSSCQRWETDVRMFVRKYLCARLCLRTDAMRRRWPLFVVLLVPGEVNILRLCRGLLCCAFFRRMRARTDSCTRR